MQIENSTLDGNELQREVDRLIGDAELSANEKHLRIEAAGHYVIKNPADLPRGDVAYYLGFIRGDRWVSAATLQTAIKRAYVLARTSQ